MHTHEHRTHTLYIEGKHGDDRSLRVVASDRGDQNTQSYKQERIEAPSLLRLLVLPIRENL